MTGVDAIAQEGAALVAQAESPVQASWLAGAWGRLTAPSPRDEMTLSQDAFVLIVNGAMDARSGGAATEAKLGEGVMDCVYALASGGGVGGQSPLARLFRGVVGFFSRLRRPSQPSGGIGPQMTTGPT